MNWSTYNRSHGYAGGSSVLLRASIGGALLLVCLCGRSLAAPSLVSRDSAGSPGAGHSGAVEDPPGSIRLRSASATDTGSVFFLTQAGLASTDTNTVADYYRFAAGPGAEGVDLARGFPVSDGNALNGVTADDGAAHYLFRRNFQLQVEEYRVTAAGRSSAYAYHSSVPTSCDIAGGGAFGVEERQRHIYLRRFSDGSEIAVTNGNGGVGRE